MPARRRPAALSAALAILLASPAAARAQPPAAGAPVAGPAAPAEDGSALVAELEVVGRPPGPAMWRVRRGPGEVMILGAVSPLPHTLAWDEARVRRALDGARELIVTEPRETIGLFEAPAAALQVVRLRALTPLPRRLPAELYARVAAAARLARLNPAKLDGWRPAAAGAVLVDAFQRAAGLSRAKPTSTVERLARAARVPVREVTRTAATPFLNSFARLDEASQQRCLAAAVDEVDWEAGHAVAAARAWADGRVAQARAERSKALWSSCLEDVPGVRALTARGVQSTYAAMQEALSRPGRSVAVVDLRYLDVRDGLLDRLRASGAQVDTPPA